MGGRIEELRKLRDRLAARDEGAADAVKRVAQALRGSGGTFGFQELSACAALVEASSPSEILRRAEGLIEYLHRVRDVAPTSAVRAEWLRRAAGMAASDSTYADIPTAWA